MASILGKMEKIKEKVGIGAGMAGRDVVVDVELPSFVDDRCEDIVVWEEGCNMQRVEANVNDGRMLAADRDWQGRDPAYEKK